MDQTKDIPNATVGANEPTNKAPIGTWLQPTPTAKLSAKSICGAAVKKMIKEAGGKPEQVDDEGKIIADANWVELFRAFGQVITVKTGNSTFGEWVAYAGKLFGENSVTGEVFLGRELFLPSEADIVLREPITAATKDGEIVELAIAVEAKFSKTAVGYTYRCKPLMVLDQPETRASQIALKFARRPPTPVLAAPVEPVQSVESKAAEMAASAGKSAAPVEKGKKAA